MRPNIFFIAFNSTIAEWLGELQLCFFNELDKKYDVILAQTEEALWFSRFFLQFQLVFILCFSILRHIILVVKVTGKLRNSRVVAVSTHLISHLSESFAKNRNILTLLRKSVS